MDSEWSFSLDFLRRLSPDANTGDGYPETIEWVPFDTDKTIYPTFFKTELAKPRREIKHIVSDER